MKYGYCRVSTKDQTTEQQEKALLAAGCERIYKETASGAKRDRPELTKMLDHAREGDTVTIWKLDRLARSLQHLIDLAAMFEKRGIHLVSITDSIDTSSASGRLLFHMLGSVAQFERDIIQERVQAGLKRAWASGKKSGRKPKLDQEQMEEAADLLAGGKRTMTEVAKKYGVHRTTLRRLLSDAKLISEEICTSDDFAQDFASPDSPKKGKNRGHLRVVA